VFRPDLTHKPVAVLSNNDGCIVARSNEVKALGVPMGAPEFEYRTLLRKNEVTLFSANFALYGDFSRRVVEVLKMYTPHIEVYSVDESFLEVDSLLIDDYQRWGQNLRNQIYNWLGLPVSMGIAPTKTLAKLGATYAKKHNEIDGVAVLMDGESDLYKEALSATDIGDVWGVGRRLETKLRQSGLRTAKDLASVAPRWARQQMTITGEKTVRELNGQSCYPLGQTGMDDGQKSLSVTRSFSKGLRSASDLEKMIATFCFKAAWRLRQNHQISAEITVFIRTGVNDQNKFSASQKIRLPYPASDTSVIAVAAMDALARIYNSEHVIKKAGVIMSELLSETARQTTLGQINQDDRLDKREQLMTAVDVINTRYGSHAVRLATQGEVTSISAHSQRLRQSPRYTTEWSELRTI
jgi:DNA polymerase V